MSWLKQLRVWDFSLLCQFNKKQCLYFFQVKKIL